MKNTKVLTGIAIALGVVILVLMTILIIGLAGQKKKAADTDKTTTEAVTEAASEEVTEAATEATTEATTEKVTEAATEKATEKATEAASEENSSSTGDAIKESAGVVRLSDDTTVSTVVGSAESDTDIVYERLKFTLPKNWSGPSAPDANKCYFFYTDHGMFMLNRQYVGTVVDFNSSEALEGCINGATEGGFNNVRHVDTVKIGDRNGYVLQGDYTSGESHIDGTIVYCQIDGNEYTIIIADYDGGLHEGDIESIINSLDIE